MRRLTYILLVFFMLIMGGCTKTSKTETKMLDGALDTVSTVTLYDWNGGEKPIDEIFALLVDIDARMSAVSAQSEISLASSQLGNPAAVSEDTFSLIEYAQSISSETRGAFDITIRPVVGLWGIGTENMRVPTQSEIDAALLSIGYNDVALDKTALTVTLLKPGMQLDLGGIAKGYACDRAVEILKRAKVEHAIIDMGGNIYAFGAKPDGSLWRVGVKIPLVGETGYFGVLEVANNSVVTSGIYERFFESDGELYHHIMDPRTGRPVKNGLISVTIISGSSTQADALSTACFVLGLERGLEYLNSLPDVEGVFVTDDLSVWTSEGLEDTFQITDTRFQLVN